MRIFNPDDEMQFAGHPVLGTAWVARRAAAARCHRARDGIRDRRRSSSIATSRARIVFGRMEQPLPDDRARRGRRGAPLAALGRRALGAPGGAVRQRRDPHRGDARRARTPSLRSPRTRPRSLVRRHRRQLRRRRRRALEDPDVLAARRGCRDRLGRRADRVPPLPARTRRWGDWIEISQGAEIGRPSTLFARADGAGGEIERVFCGGTRGRRRAGRVPALGDSREEAGDRSRRRRGRPRPARRRPHAARRTSRSTCRRRPWGRPRLRRGRRGRARRSSGVMTHAPCEPRVRITSGTPSACSACGSALPTSVSASSSFSLSTSTWRRASPMCASVCRGPTVAVRTRPWRSTRSRRPSAGSAASVSDGKSVRVSAQTLTHSASPTAATACSGSQ